MVQVNGFVRVDDILVVSVESEFGVIGTFIIVSRNAEELPDESSDKVSARRELVFVHGHLNCQTLSHDGNDIVVRSINKVAREDSSISVWLQPEDVGVGWVEDESLDGQVAVSSIEPQSSVVNGVWVGGVFVFTITSVDLDVVAVFLILSGISPVDVLGCVLTLELEVGNDTAVSVTLSESGLEEASGADIVAAVKLVGVEHVAW